MSFSRKYSGRLRQLVREGHGLGTRDLPVGIACDATEDGGGVDCAPTGREEPIQAEAQARVNSRPVWSLLG